MMPSQLRTTLILFAALLCSLVIAGAGVGLYGTRMNHDQVHRLLDHSAIAEQVTAINYKVFDSRLHIALALANPSEERMAKEAKVIEENLVALSQARGKLEAIHAPTELAEPIREFIGVVTVFSESYLTPAAKTMHTNDGSGLEKLLNTQGDRFYSPIKQGRERIQQAQKTAKDALIQATVATETTTFQLTVGVSILALLLGVLFSIQTTRTLTRQTSALSITMTQLAQEHDLSARVQLAGDSELAALGTQLNHVINSLNGVLRQVSQHAQAAQQAGQTLMGEAGAAEAMLAQQNQAVQQARAALESMLVQVHTIAERVGETVTLTSDSEVEGERGAHMVKDVAEVMAEIAARVTASSDEIFKLGEQSAQVDQIVVTIQQIAEQTNLLALNAAIEAARAGEAGRGFAVVADEVRKLAERTQMSTAEIQHTLGAIRTETDHAVENMSTSRRKVEEGIIRAGVAAEAIVGVRERLGTINARIHDINHAIRAQEQASDAVSANMQSVAQAAEEGAMRAQTTRQAASEVSSLGVKLRDEVSRFRL